jgi:predicted GNAT superfamily acetyltransferase
MTETLTDLGSADPAARAAALALNAAHETETAPLDAGRLETLLAMACAAPALADGRAFLLAFDEAARYDSPNFLWVTARFPRVVYVDRVIVAPELRRRGLARALYGAVLDIAEARGAPVVCEVNAVPPNPGSDAFHAALGFTEIGRGAPAPGKKVRYLARAPRWQPDGGLPPRGQSGPAAARRTG